MRGYGMRTSAWKGDTDRQGRLRRLLRCSIRRATDWRTSLAGTAIFKFYILQFIHKSSTFQKPAPCWFGHRDATKFPPLCIQFRIHATSSDDESEDCLYLN